MLEIHSLSVAYGKRLALEDVSLSVQRVKCWCWRAEWEPVNPPCCAHQRCAAVLQRHIQIGGRDLAALAGQRARYLPSCPGAHLPAAFTLPDVLLDARLPGWLGSNAQDHAAYAALELTQALDLAERRVGELRRRAAARLVSRALAQDTPVCCWTSQPPTWTCSTNPICSNLVRTLFRSTTWPY